MELAQDFLNVVKVFAVLYVSVSGVFAVARLTMKAVRSSG